MVNIQIMATYTDTKENMEAFAYLKGYREVLVDEETQEETPNPETYKEFLTRWAKKQLHSMVVNPTAAMYKQEAQLAAKVQIEELSTTIDQNLDVNINEQE